MESESMDLNDDFERLEQAMKLVKRLSKTWLMKKDADELEDAISLLAAHMEMELDRQAEGE